MPLGVVVAGANRPDMKLLEATLQSIPVKRPRVTKKHPQHLCLDAGYDYPAVHELVEKWGFTAHIRPQRAAAETHRPFPATGRAAGWWSGRTHG
jgi:putative transposase